MHEFVHGEIFHVYTPPLHPPFAQSPRSPMNQTNFVNDPQDLSDALNEEEDISPHTIALKPSSYYDFEEFQKINSEPHFYKKKFHVIS